MQSKNSQDLYQVIRITSRSDLDLRSFFENQSHARQQVCEELGETTTLPSGRGSDILQYAIIQIVILKILSLQLYQKSNLGFSDCLIQVESQAENCDIVTFDKKFAKLPHVKLLIEASH